MMIRSIVMRVLGALIVVLATWMEMRRAKMRIAIY